MLSQESDEDLLGSTGSETQILALLPTNSGIKPNEIIQRYLLQIFLFRFSLYYLSCGSFKSFSTFSKGWLICITPSLFVVAIICVAAEAAAVAEGVEGSADSGI